MDAGHGGASGRYKRYRETAFQYAFLLDVAGREKPLDTPPVKIGAEDITCEEARELIGKHEGDPGFVILDLRPVEKFKKAHLENAVYRDVFAADFDEWMMELDRNKTYLLYCTIGKRSRVALDKMKAAGFQNVYHMYEGVRVWEAKGYKTLADKT
jgi:rhodanese-related sulfurtransferase